VSILHSLQMLTYLASTEKNYLARQITHGHIDGKREHKEDLNRLSTAERL